MSPAFFYGLYFSNYSELIVRDSSSKSFGCYEELVPPILLFYTQVHSNPLTSSFSGTPAGPEPLNQRQHGFEPPRQTLDTAEQVS